jgi:ABC-type branched-subunit amino acid transport system ATPase component
MTEGLHVISVTKRFGGVVAVSDASVSVDVGGVHGLIGPNGAGKSTIIGLISGFLRPDAGGLRFGHRDLVRLTPAAIAGLGISRTFQQATPLVGLTVLENILVGMHTRYRSRVPSILLRATSMRREARDLARSAQALLDMFGLSALADTDAADLTFGKLRLLEMARSVAMRPRILLLDEPAAGLNRWETEQVGQLIRRLRDEGMGVLVVDHDVPFVFNICDRVTVMNFGRVIASGAPEEVYQDPAVREAYLGTRETRERST